MVRAFVGQSIVQRPQPVHFSLSMRGIPCFLSRIIFKNSRRLILSLDRNMFKSGYFLPTLCPPLTLPVRLSSRRSPLPAGEREGLRGITPSSSNLQEIKAPSG